MFGFTQWKGLIGGAHVPDWTCFTPVGLHCIKGSLSPLGAVIRTRGNAPNGKKNNKNPLDRHCSADGVGLKCNAVVSVYAGKIHKYAYKAPTGRKHGQGRCCTGLETLYLWTDVYMHARTLRNDRGWSPLQSLGVSVVQHKAGPVCARLWNGMWTRGQRCDTRHHLHSSLSSFAVLNFY